MGALKLHQISIPPEDFLPEIDEEFENTLEYDNERDGLSATRDLDIEDGDTTYGPPVEMVMSNAIGKALLVFIRERQEVMRLLKIHPMSILSPEMQVMYDALETLFPEVERVDLSG